MKNHIQLTSVSMKTTPLDFEGNFQKIATILQKPSIKDSSIVVFPELCLSGYGCEDAFLYSTVCEKSLQLLNQLLPFSKNRMLAIGLPLLVSPNIYNACAILYNEKILGFVTKNCLANRSVFYENRWFSRADAYENEMFGEERTPVGNLFFRFLDATVGVQICEDLWKNNASQLSLFEMGADVMLVLNASPFEMEKQEERLELLKQKTKNYNCILLYSNLNGNESGNLIFDGGACIVANGEVFAQTERLHFDEFQIASATFDLKTLKQKRIKTHIKSLDFHLLPRATEQFIEEKIANKSLQVTSAIQTEKVDRFNDFTKAVCLGLWDYLLKSCTKGYTISLSGGVDSAVCAILVHTMKSFVLQKFGIEIFTKYALNEKEILQTVYQKTENNSSLTEQIALTLSQEINSQHHTIQIDSEIKSIRQKVENAKQLTLDWQNHNLSLQNIQARVRSPIIWMFANLSNHLLISTSNRSESSVGYCTMDGDTSGSIAPIAGVSKKFLLDFLHHIQQGKNAYISPLKSIESLLSTKPTAELKPISEMQEDEKDLMPYDILDKIEYEFVQNGKTQEEILHSIDFEDKQKLKEYIEKYFHLFQINQWKRNRSATTFHLDKYDLDYKANFRFPIFSGKW